MDYWKAIFDIFSEFLAQDLKPPQRKKEYKEVLGEKFFSQSLSFGSWQFFSLNELEKIILGARTKYGKDVSFAVGADGYDFDEPYLQVRQLETVSVESDELYFLRLQNQLSTYLAEKEARLARENAAKMKRRKEYEKLKLEFD